MASTVIAGGALGQGIFETEYYSVWVKQRWADDWQFVPYLFPNESVEHCWPEISSASFIWEYGEFLNLWDDPGDILIPLNLQDWFISIWVSTPYGDFLGWIGVVTGEGLKVEGLDSATGIDRGVQVIRANGLEDILRKRIVQGSYVQDPESGEVAYLPRGRAFNKRYGKGLSLLGNRSADVESEFGVYTFGDDGEVWNNRHVVEYLLAMFGGTEVPFYLAGQVEILEQIEREWEFDGKDMFSALGELIDRKRGMIAHLVTAGAGPVFIEVLSISETAISGEGVYLPPNPLPMDLEAGEDPNIDMSLNIEALNAYDEIIVRSAEAIKAVFTAGFDDGTLEEGWPAEDEADYVVAEDKARTADYLSRVFAFFRVPKNFDWAGVSPYVDELGYVDPEGQGAYWNTDVSFERYLLWLEEAGMNETEPEFVEPFGVILVPETTGEGEDEEDTSYYCFLDKLETLDKPGLQMRMADQEFGIIVRGRAAHLVALNHWPEGTIGSVSPEYDYETLLFTVCVKTDEILKVTLPVLDGGWASPLGKQIIMTVPGIECWIIAPNTVVDVEEGELVIYDGEPILRDDSDKLRAIAYLAWVWFGQQRATLDVRVKNNLNWFGVGSLVLTAVNGLSWERVGTVITAIRRNYVDHEQYVTTGWAELDPQEFVQAL